jgi:hypothetical protein
MEADRPRNELFMTHHYSSYVKVVGLAANASAPVNTQADLQCFYPSMHPKGLKCIFKKFSTP